jgi:threonine aldolase
MPPRLDMSPAGIERRRVFAACERSLHGHGRRSAAQALALLQAELQDCDDEDQYGYGESLQSFEAEVASELGKPAALFFPSGTLAQQVALRIWCEQRGINRVAWHASTHLEQHCDDVMPLAHGVQRVLPGAPMHVLTPADLIRDLVEPCAALLLELPQREIGGEMPSWEDLQEMLRWSRERGLRLHLDGARLFESRPFYQRSHAEICAGFDSVYVSLYKGLGGLTGAMLAGPIDFLEQARRWRQRLGGNLIHHWPAILAARAGWRRGFARFDDYFYRARAVARVLSELPGLRIRPAIPSTNMMHITLEGDPRRLMAASESLARRRSIRLFTGLRPTGLPGLSVFELAIGDAAAALSDDEVREAFREVLTEARAT